MSKSMLYEFSDEILLRQGNSLRLKARGSSMKPFVKDGDFVEVKPIDNFQEIDSGDILLFKNQNTLCLHRLLRMESEMFVIKGDSHREIDGAICKENIIGKLISVERSGHLIPFKNGWFNKLSSFSWIWYRLVYITKESAKPFIKPLHNLFLSVPLVRIFLKNYFGKKVVIVIAKPEDAFDICVFYRQHNPEAVRSVTKQIVDEESYYVISRLRDKIIGCASLHFDSKLEPWNGWWLNGLQVRFVYKGIGAGQSIVNLAIEKVKEIGGSSLKLFAFKGRKPAGSLYEKLGFEKVIDPEIEKLLEDEAKTAQRRIYMVKQIKSVKKLIAEKVNQLPENIIKSQSLGSFLYGTGVSKKETYRNNYASTLATNELLKKKEAEILKAFHDSGIDAVSIKGVNLIEDLYGDLGLRPTTDIDLLIRSDQLGDCINILENKRYQSPSKQLTKETLFQPTFISDEEVSIDLHWELLKTQRCKGIVKLSTIDAIENSIKKSNFSMLNVEDQLTFLLIHISIPHFFSSLYWLIDLGLFLDKYQSYIDWNKMLKKLRKSNLLQTFLLVLNLSKKFFGLNFPYLEKGLSPLKLRTKFVEKYIKKCILSCSFDKLDSRRHILGILVRDSLKDMLVIFLHALFPPRQWVKEKYNIKNGRLVGFYRFIHPIYSLLVGIFGYSAIRRKGRA